MEVKFETSRRPYASVDTLASVENFSCFFFLEKLYEYRARKPLYIINLNPILSNTHRSFVIVRDICVSYRQ